MASIIISHSTLPIITQDYHLTSESDDIMGYNKETFRGKATLLIILEFCFISHQSNKAVTDRVDVMYYYAEI